MVEVELQLEETILAKQTIEEVLEVMEELMVETELHLEEIVLAKEIVEEVL